VKKILAYLFIIPIHFYQWCISPFLAPSCRHTPTCSTYSVDALKRFGILKGTKISAVRISQCRPGGTYGDDPVPKFLAKKKRFSFKTSRFMRKNRKRLPSHW
jgi:uncharacterized protein